MTITMYITGIPHIVTALELAVELELELITSVRMHFNV